MNSPTPSEVRAARHAAGLTQTQAGLLVHVTYRTWAQWESPVGNPSHRRMLPAVWQLFKIKISKPVAWSVFAKNGMHRGFFDSPQDDYLRPGDRQVPLSEDAYTGWE